MSINLFYENVPLVTTETLGDFREAELIGHHYGDLSRSRVRCIRISPTKWLVGAHAWQSISGCWVGGKKITGFEPQALTDADGVTRQYVILNRPPESEQYVVEVAGQGKQSPTNGKLLENPDEIIQDLAAVCGKTLTFPAFREAANRRGLRIAGSIYEARTLRDYINEIVESCGAKWLGDDAYFYPDILPYARSVPHAVEIVQEIHVDDVAGQLGVYYGWNHSNQRNGSYIEAKAVGGQYTNQGVIIAKWLRQARDAEALARQQLARRAGEFVRVRAILPGVYRAGQCVQISAKAYSGAMLIQTARNNEAQTEVTGEIILSSFSNIAITRYSAENLTTRSERIDVAYQNGIVTFTILDVQNRPLENIFVSLDNGAAKKTNAKGQVQFNTAPGDHIVTLTGGDVGTDPYPVYIQ